FTEKGKASWYGKKFHGHLTSNGEIYDMYSMSAAHKTLPIPSYVKVTNTDNNKTTIVRINDRGPFHEGRIIDLSYAAAYKLDVLRTGTANVEIEVITV
ncbi:MAG TPA: septal ring lytic transglycosylase RlpA, partial [Vibrio sp.]|nr:septal ring lytic transglycosylase RlpA [Vibrio sp.]